jgi:hypothetical protein
MGITGGSDDGFVLAVRGLGKTAFDDIQLDSYIFLWDRHRAKFFGKVKSFATCTKVSQRLSMC